MHSSQDEFQGSLENKDQFCVFSFPSLFQDSENRQCLGQHMMRQHPSWKEMFLGAEARREEGRALWPSSSCSLTHSTHCSQGLWLRVKESAHIPRYRSGSRHRRISHPAPESSKKGPERMVTQAQIKSSWSSTKNEKKAVISKGNSLPDISLKWAL